MILHLNHTNNLLYSGLLDAMSSSNLTMDRQGDYVVINDHTGELVGFDLSGASQTIMAGLAAATSGEAVRDLLAHALDRALAIDTERWGADEFEYLELIIPHRDEDEDTFEFNLATLSARFIRDRAEREAIVGMAREFADEAEVNA